MTALEHAAVMEYAAAASWLVWLDEHPQEGDQEDRDFAVARLARARLALRPFVNAD